jgi:DNA (cytosine-5)-methyltransferase 1
MKLKSEGVVWSIYRNMQNSSNDESKVAKKKWRTVDLFAGVGGIRLGFENAGFTTVFANDFEIKCADTYDMNFKSTKLVVEDITNIKTEDIPDCDFLLGGFPCQAFSIAGYRKGFGDDKGRGNLFFDITRILEDKKTRWFLTRKCKKT